MAKIVPSAMIESISGRAGGIYFQRRQGQTSMSTRRKIAVSQSAAAQQIKAVSSSLRSEWSLLSTEQRLSWNALARLITSTSQSVKLKQQRGYTLFLKYNFYPLLYGDSITGDAPATYQTESSDGFLWSWIAPGSFLVANQVIGTAGTRYQIYFARRGQRGSQRSALSSRKSFLLVKDGVTLRNVATEYTATFGARINDQLLEIGCITQRVGYFPSPYVSDTHIV